MTYFFLPTYTNWSREKEMNNLARLFKSLIPKINFYMTDYDDAIQISIYKIWLGNLISDIEFELPATDFNKDQYQKWLSAQKPFEIR